PKARHALVYPAVAPVPLSEKGRGIMIVASDNYANFVSMRWFLNGVLPLAGDVAVSIYGNIDVGVKNRDRALYEAHRALFKGRIADLGAVYAYAACILLPTVEGHGLSIKAVEALSSGAPLIATTAAFRGMGVDSSRLANVTLREDAPGFAAALRENARPAIRGGYTTRSSVRGPMPTRWRGSPFRCLNAQRRRRLGAHERNSHDHNASSGRDRRRHRLRPRQRGRLRRRKRAGDRSLSPQGSDDAVPSG